MWAAAVTLCTSAVGASEPDVLVTHLAIERAGDYDLIGRPVVYYCMVRLQAPCYGHVKCVSHVRTVLGLNAELLVLQGWAQTAYSCISTLRCRTTVTAVSSERLCV